MYIPKQFKVEDQEKLIQFIQQNSFGILVSINQGESTATHLPFLYDTKSNRLVSHMARKNTQWSELENSNVLVIFTGPHAYISPSWYEEQHSVPTWNYVSVHVYGELSAIDDTEKAGKILKDTADYFESNREQPWTPHIENEFNQSLLEHITAFEIKITRMEGAWKLNQHHSDAKRKKVIAQLKKQNDENSQKIAKLMEEYKGG